MGLVLSCIFLVGLVPAAYCGMAYEIFHHHPERDRVVLAGVAAVLAALSGLVQTWDVAIRPGPKLGADWRFRGVNDYLSRTGVYHLVAMPVLAGGLDFILWNLRSDTWIGSIPLITWGLFFLFFCGSTPIDREGPHAGVPLSSE
jgi:hypothetical protein